MRYSILKHSVLMLSLAGAYPLLAAGSDDKQSTSTLPSTQVCQDEQARDVNSQSPGFSELPLWSQFDRANEMAVQALDDVLSEIQSICKDPRACTSRRAERESVNIVFRDQLFPNLARLLMRVPRSEEVNENSLLRRLAESGPEDPVVGETQEVLTQVFNTIGEANERLYGQDFFLRTNLNAFKFWMSITINAALDLREQKSKNEDSENQRAVQKENVDLRKSVSSLINKLSSTRSGQCKPWRSWEGPGGDSAGSGTSGGSTSGSASTSGNSNTERLNLRLQSMMAGGEVTINRMLGNNNTQETVLGTAVQGDARSGTSGGSTSGSASTSGNSNTEPLNLCTQDTVISANLTLMEIWRNNSNVVGRTVGEGSQTLNHIWKPNPCSGAPSQEHNKTEF